MDASRRFFLRSVGIGAAASATARWPLLESSTGSGVESVPRKDGGYVLLNSNENAYGPSSRVDAAIRSAIGRANRYAFASYNEVVEQIARSHRVKPNQVLLGCGSTEILRAASCAFLGSRRQLIQGSPTYEAMEEYARAVDSEVVSVPLDKHFAHDLHAMQAKWTASTGLVYICNPHNPTASTTPRLDLESFIGKLPATTRILIDEAYHHYAIPSGTYASFIDRPLADERVIVTRTFSAVYGMAGLRLGYAVAAPKVVEQMRRFITLDTLNSVVAEAAIVALDDVDGVKASVKRNSDDRQEFYNSAMIRMLMPISSQANFVMTDTQHPADEVIEHFRRHNILIGRRFPPMDSFIRVSLGTPPEMRAFWQVWDMLPWAKLFMHH